MTQSLPPGGTRPHAPRFCVSRRRVLSRAAAWAAGATLAAGAASRALAVYKVPKTQAGYKDDARGGNRCDRCLQFLPPGGCKIVDGAVSPQGSCNFFAPRA